MQNALSVGARLKPLVACGLAALALSAQATEGGLNTAAAGAEGFMAGALPPPGTYGLFYFNHYQADRFNDGGGQSMVPGFKVSADALVGRVVHVTDIPFMGGLVGAHAVLPLVRLKVDAAGASDSRTGLGDLEFGPFVTWHWTDWHAAAALDFVVPTGSYEATRMANTGNNITTVRPLLAVSYLTPSVDLSTKITYSFNGRNSDTDYTSGQYLHADWNAGWRLDAQWQVGLQGTLVQQTTDDKRSGAVVGDGWRSRVHAFGPAVHYQHPSGLSLEARVLRETSARYHTEGTAVWLKAVMKF
ncbi:hypothetical protein C7444_12629 [Sphaerotilus hippei]|uniref:Outer membrane beta-barrel porin/alpha-amylase n=1 Tax=Sphaerotilus hippei TaxID=744406 RepID=A0A318GX29_9BURK|nr:transporter [Sphaerotilus hippei]PXW92309.1 hypothetical protein C7444_12629 [Sphaerotilus hippei]